MKWSEFSKKKDEMKWHLFYLTGYKWFDFSKDKSFQHVAFKSVGMVLFAKVNIFMLS